MKRLAIPALLVALLIVWLAPAWMGTTASADTTDTTDTTDTEATAGDDGAKAEKAEVKGSDSKGKYFFKKTCKSCHGKDGDGGEITPVSKTIKQWERFFKKEKHTDEQKLLEIEGLDEIKAIHIKTFLINHAADSDQPETCG